MSKKLFSRYIWLVDTILRAGRITFEEVNRKWLLSSLSDGMEIPLKTFHNHRKAIEDIFDINISCDRKDGYRYYIENTEDLQNDGLRKWLLNSITINNLSRDSLKLKERIILEDIPSGQQFLPIIIEAMRDGCTLMLEHKSFWNKTVSIAEVEPFFVKFFKQRWYMIAKNKSLNEIRTYAVDRIINLNKAEHSFIMPCDFDPETYFQNSFGIIADKRYPPEHIELKVYGTKTDYFRTLPLHHSQKEIETCNKYSVFRYFISPTYDFIQEILSHGYEVEVLSPSHLKGYIKWQAETILAR